jgi:acyl-CoA thioesterase
MNDIELTKENIIKYFDKFPGFSKHNNIKLEELTDDKAVLYVEMDEKSYNPSNIAHGGLIYGLVDQAMGTLAYANGHKVVTIDSNINFMRPCKGKKMKCVATPVKVGKTIAFYKADVYNEDEELAASATGTYYFLDK